MKKIEQESEHDVAYQGVRAYQYTDSNFRPWQDYEGDDVEQLALRFEQSPLVEDWEEANLLTEVMLLLGFPLDSYIESLPELTANHVRRVTSDFLEYAMVVCFDEKIQQATIDGLALEEQDVFVCLDSALTDESKMRLDDICKLRVI